MPVTYRSRVCAGAFRSDFEKAERIDARDAAAAGADLDHVDHRDAHGQTAAFAKTINAVDFELVRLQGLAVFDDTKLGGRAAHIEGKQIAMAGSDAGLRRRERSGRRSGFEQTHRKARRSLACRNAAAR